MVCFRYALPMMTVAELELEDSISKMFRQLEAKQLEEVDECHTFFFHTQHTEEQLDDAHCPPHFLSPTRM